GTSVTHPALQAAFQQDCSQGPPGAAFAYASGVVVAGATVTFTDRSSGAPTSWAWDLNGDGVTDSTAANPSFTYGAPGTFDVTLTAGNGLGSHSITLPAAVKVLVKNPVQPPYVQPFTAGLPADGSWSFTASTGLGAIATGAS